MGVGSATGAGGNAGVGSPGNDGGFGGGSNGGGKSGGSGNSGEASVGASVGIGGHSVGINDNSSSEGKDSQGGVSGSKSDSSTSSSVASSIGRNNADNKSVETPSVESVANLGKTQASRTGTNANHAKASIAAAARTQTAKAKAVSLASRANPKNDKQFDGMLVGKKGKTYPAGTPLSKIDAVVPKNGVRNSRTAIHVNGVNTTLATQVRSMQALADRTGSRVVGVHNSTAGLFRDVAQALGDKLNIGKNPAIDSVAKTIYSELKAGRQVNVFGHSQGALIASRALTDVRNQFQLEDGMTRQQAEALLGKVNAETFGGAAATYPDGPNYVHYLNRDDILPTLFGVAGLGGKPGRDAVIHFFNKNTNPHGFDDTYLPNRVPFDQARQGIFQ